MEQSISERLQHAGQELLQSSGQDFVPALNRVLAEVIGWPYRVSTAAVSDLTGKATEPFGAVIYVPTQPGSGSSASAIIPGDNVAAVIEVAETLTPETLRAAYERIATAKSIRKNPAPRIPGAAHTTTTLGIILAKHASVPLESLAKELDTLNSAHSDREWPDIVVVLSTGIINFAVQFPGEGLSGDYLPPAEGATSNFTAPMYIVLVVRPTAAFTFNKMCAFLFAHLAIFSPGAKLPIWAEVLRGIPMEAMVICGYQYNLKGQLLPVPRKFYNDRYLSPPPAHITAQDGTPLASLQFLPWQDGGVVLLKGKLPLEGLLVFLGKKGLERAGIVRRGDMQISYALPITESDFREMLGAIQRQSNMKVVADPTSFVVQKFADEGSSSPFMARLFLGPQRLRDAALLTKTDHDAFDKAFNFVAMTLLNTRTTARTIQSMITEHKRKVAEGSVARLRGRNINVDEDISKDLRKEVESFLNGAVRVLKHGMQETAKALGTDIGFLFQKAFHFEKASNKLQSTDPSLAAYLTETRKNWSQRLVDSSRNAMEHTGWMLPSVKYVATSNGPQIDGQNVTDFVDYMLDRLSCFVEEITVHCLQRRFPEGISITMIPQEERDSTMPLRFQPALSTGGTSIWKIAYHATKFEDV